MSVDEDTSDEDEDTSDEDEDTDIEDRPYTDLSGKPGSKRKRRPAAKRRVRQRRRSLDEEEEAERQDIQDMMVWYVACNAEQAARNVCKLLRQRREPHLAEYRLHRLLLRALGYDATHFDHMFDKMLLPLQYVFRDGACVPLPPSRV